MDRRDLKEGQEVYVKSRVIHTGDHLDIVLDKGSFIENAIILHHEKPVIPKFVARAIETHKALGKSLHSLSYLTNNKEYNEWLRSDMKIKPERFEMVARAWLNGYEVEKEKLYTAKLKLITISYVNYINKRSGDGAIVLSDLNTASGNYQTSFSRSELEQLNVWDNPVFEIEEAE